LQPLRLYTTDRSVRQTIIAAPQNTRMKHIEDRQS
jgi:hypothetical protein